MSEKNEPVARAWISAQVLHHPCAAHCLVPQQAPRAGWQRRATLPDAVLVVADIRARPSHRHNHRDGRETISARFGDQSPTPIVGASRQ